MRTPTALVTQREFRKKHGDAIAADLDLNLIGYPILNHRDHAFWICDGQHRVYALRQNGFSDYEIDCDVYEDLSDREMAHIFLGHNDGLAVSTFDKFFVACTAEYEREMAIRRIVESHNLKISRRHDRNCIGAVSALGKVHDSSGDVVLGQVVRTLKKAYDGEAVAFDGAIIQSLGQVYNRFNGRTDEKHMIEALAAFRNGVHGILRKAEGEREKHGLPRIQCIAKAIVDLYNRGLNRKQKLDDWFKNNDEETEATS